MAIETGGPGNRVSAAPATPPEDPREFGAAFADVLASMPLGAEFSELYYRSADYLDEGESPRWEASVTLASEDKCSHVAGCRHGKYRRDVEGTGSTAHAALRDLAEKLRRELGLDEVEEPAGTSALDDPVIA